MTYLNFKRILDVAFVLVLVPFLIFPIVFIMIAIFLTSDGPVIHWSKRVGKDNKEFLMPKFRTMYIGTPNVATHLLNNQSYITPLGNFLRKTSLDEIPQLFSIFKGDMSFVGPRPALFNQEDLISLRSIYGVDALVPGITGWAQINGRDSIAIEEKVKLDAFYLKNINLILDLKIIIITALNVIQSRDISH